MSMREKTRLEVLKRRRAVMLLRANVVWVVREHGVRLGQLTVFAAVGLGYTKDLGHQDFWCWAWRRCASAKVASTSHCSDSPRSAWSKPNIGHGCGRVVGLSRFRQALRLA